jgi:tetratricopeptide (TPR) repeat protein
MNDMPGHHRRRSPRRQLRGAAHGLLVLLAAALLSLWPPAQARPSEPSAVFSPEELLEFAHHLFSQGEYFRAITEYQRFLFLYPDSGQAPTAALRIAECYVNGKKWQQVLDSVADFLDHYAQSSLECRARFLRVRALSELDRGKEARSELRTIVSTRRGQPQADEARYLVALSYAREGRWLEAESALRQIGRESPVFGAAQAVQEVLNEASKQPTKDPALSGVLSAVLPGAGHLYCERPRDAAVAFLVTGAFVGATVEAFDRDHEHLGAGLGLISLAFYAGGIFSAVNVAHKYNEREERRLHRRLAPLQQIGLHRLESAPVSVAVTFRF